MQTFCLYIPTDIELSYRLLLSLHSIKAVSVYPSLVNSWPSVNIAKCSQRNTGSFTCGPMVQAKSNM